MKKNLNNDLNVEVIDLFCGIGGLSYGMKSKGFKILAGFDLDYTCQYAYEINNEAKFVYKDIKEVTKDDILPLYSKDAIKVLAGCAPCQPFSSYAFKNKTKDPNKYDLLYEFGRLVKEVKPDIVTMENVPAIQKFKLKNVLQDFIEVLKKEGYVVSEKVVYCPDYGIPQTRKRFVLLASKIGEIKLISPTHTKENYVTVRDTIGNLPPIEAGEISGAVITDVTKSEMDREKIAKRAREVISKNIATVQEIACLLGEHMVETEVLLDSIAKGYETNTDGE